jgi:hypothetical protein
MSRFDELKKQYPEFNITILDILSELDNSKSYKYLPLICKIIKWKTLWAIDNNHSKEDRNNLMSNIKQNLISCGFKIENLSEKQLVAYYELKNLFASDEELNIINDFIDLMNKNKIKQKDVSSYSNVEDLRSAVTVATLNEINKGLEKQIIKEYEDDTWLCLRPLTFQSSAKYGYNTKWCTTFKSEKQYFERYWRTGILVYFINKKTGYKFAGFKSLDNLDISFWNPADQQVNLLNLDLGDNLFPILKKIFSSNNTNKELCSDELQNEVYYECVGDYNKMSITGYDEPREIGIDIPVRQQIEDDGNVNYERNNYITPE